MENNIGFNKKRAAMFGLDARIALAIFGALSVISGAALYSAIQTARANALYTNLLEFGKAWESYYLDTGDNLVSAGSDFIEAVNLIENKNNLKNWNGPYISYKAGESDNSLLPNIKLSQSSANAFLLLITKDINWAGNSGNSWNYGSCVTNSSASCSIWVHFQGVEYAISSKIDEMVDSGDGPETGRVRWKINGINSWDNLYVEYANIKNPN